MPALSVIIFLAGIALAAIGLLFLIINAVRKQKIKHWLFTIGGGLALFVIGTLLAFFSAASPLQPVTVTVPPKGVIHLGQPRELTAQTVPVTGGTIAFDSPGDEMNGLQITVPAGADDGAKTYRIAVSPVTGHTYGGIFNPVSPLISIDNAGGCSNEIISVKVPVNVPEGRFAMPFFYDDKNGTLEGLPVESFSDGFMTFATRHFSQIVISSIPEEMLNVEISSGFIPGIDDWQFANSGSFAAPDGHCAGQSITAMWYYNFKSQNGAAHLWGLFDNNGADPTPDLWQDDSQPYRFASSVQQDTDWQSWGRKYYLSLSSAGDAATWKQFAYSILATGQPQYIEVWDTNTGCGHAMVVYGVDRGTLRIADPNYPGITSREITYRNGGFIPYDSGANVDEIASGNTIKFDKVIYIASSALIDLGRVEKCWNELQNCTAGNNIFPSYKLEAVDETGSHEIKSTYTTDEPLLRINPTGPFPVYISIYRNNIWLDFDDEGKITLNEGNNHLGVYIKGKAGREYKFVDFRWIDVNCSPPVSPITPVTSTPTEVISGSTKINSLNYVLLNSEYDNEGYYWIKVEASGEVSGSSGAQMYVNASITPILSGWMPVLSTDWTVLEEGKWLKRNTDDPSFANWSINTQFPVTWTQWHNFPDLTLNIEAEVRNGEYGDTLGTDSRSISLEQPLQAK